MGSEVGRRYYAYGVYGNRIQHRRDTAAAWAAVDPVLASGEIGINTTSGGIRIGDGVTAWSSLSEISGGPAATPDRDIQIMVTDPAGDAITTGDGQAYFTVPESMDGANVTAFQIALTTVSSSGTPTVQLARTRSGSTVDVCSTRPVIDVSELTSYTGTSGVINGSNDDLATGDLLRIDVDTAGTGAKGLMAIITIEPPSA